MLILKLVGLKVEVKSKSFGISRWWFHIFFIFTLKFGEKIPIFDEHIFQLGLKPPTRKFCISVRPDVFFLGPLILFFFGRDRCMFFIFYFFLFCAMKFLCFLYKARYTTLADIRHRFKSWYLG